MGGPGIGHKARRAEQLGLTLDAYLALLETRKWCTRCKAFHRRELFTADTSRQDGLAASCPPPATAAGPARPDRRALHDRGWFYCADCEQWWPRSYRIDGRCKPHGRAEQRRRYRETDFGERWRAKVRARARGIAVITPQLRAELMTRFDGRCVYCGDEATGLDHFWPVARGGGWMTDGNLVPACSPCNSRKRATTDIAAWLNDEIVDTVERALIHFAVGDIAQTDADHLECCRA